MKSQNAMQMRVAFQEPVVVEQTTKKNREVVMKSSADFMDNTI